MYPPSYVYPQNESESAYISYNVLIVSSVLIHGWVAYFDIIDEHFDPLFEYFFNLIFPKGIYIGILLPWFEGSYWYNWNTKKSKYDKKSDWFEIFKFN